MQPRRRTVGVTTIWFRLRNLLAVIAVNYGEYGHEPAGQVYLIGRVK